MSRKLDRLWIRVDAQFISDDTYEALPVEIRNDAYLFLLALAGRSRVNQSDGRLRLSSVAEIGRKMHVKTNRLLDALVNESMVVITADELVLQKQDKWQTSKAEVDELRDERAAAGARGGKQKASKRVANVQQTAGNPEANGVAKPSRDRDREEIENVTSSNEDVRTARLKELRGQVCRLWAVHQGWPEGKWPSDRRDDAQLITVWVRDKGYPLEFWRSAFAQTPKDAKFRWLTTPPEEGKVCRLEEWAIARKDREYAALKAVEVSSPPVITAQLRRVPAA